MLDLAREKLDGDTACVVMKNGEAPRILAGRGLKPLWSLFRQSPDSLRDAAVADKVVGRAAAGILLFCGAAAVYGAVMSRPALAWLEEAGVTVAYGRLEDRIANRQGNDSCPMEKQVAAARTPAEAVAALREILG